MKANRDYPRTRSDLSLPVHLITATLFRRYYRGKGLPRYKLHSTLKLLHAAYIRDAKLSDKNSIRLIECETNDLCAMTGVIFFTDIIRMEFSSHIIYNI